MPVEIKMPQLSDTMSEGTLVKWLSKEGDKIKEGQVIAEVETDKATMEMESGDNGTLAALLVKEGEKVPVGAVLALLATGKESVEEIKKSGRPSAPAIAAAPVSAPPKAAAAPTRIPPAKSGTAQPAKAPAALPAKPAAPAPKANYQFDLLVIGGGPAGYAAAIRAGQLKKRVLCIERENLGGTCLNWGCIPTKALLEDGAFVRRLRTEAAERGVTVDNIRVDFSKIIGRSRSIAGKLSNGIGFLFNKHGVKHETGTAQLLAPHRVKVTGKDGTREVTADHVILAVGARATPLPGVQFDGTKVITSREAMNLPVQPKRLAIVGAGAIGCEFADFYNALGTEVTIIEMLPQLLPNEDADVSLLLKRLFEKRGITIHLETRTDKVESTPEGVRLTLAGKTGGTVDADTVLVAIGVTGNIENLAAPEAKLELFKNRVKVTPDYRTNLENVWSVGDCISLHWPTGSSMAGYRHPDLAHVAHHEAVNCVEGIFGHPHDPIDYRFIPGCTYTHPQVASMGLTEQKARDAGYEIRVGKFPFSASGRALAAGEPDGFVKLIFDAKTGELLGVHMIGETVTELLAELVLARKLEATEAEIIESMHPHPTYSEAVMEAAGVADGRAIHI